MRSRVKYRRLVERIAAAHGIGIEYNRLFARWQGGYFTSARTIRVPMVTDQISALVALHEMGHCVLHIDPAATTAPTMDEWVALPGVIQRELEAWGWAVHRLDEPLRTETVTDIIFCLSTYAKNNNA